MRGDYDTNKILVSVADALIDLFLAFILIILLLYLVLVLMAGVGNINDLRNFTIEISDIMTASSDIVISLLIIACVVLALAFLVMFVCWLSKDEKGIIILPFEVAAGEEKYSGKALSNLLTTELLRIRRIHDPEVKYKVTMIESERLNMPYFEPTNENLTYTVSQLGPVGLGTTSIHIGPLIAILKKLWPRGDSGQVISGSLQRYGSVISLVACLEHKEIRAWQASCEIRRYNREGDECIPELTKDLSFKIIRDLKHDEISANTWQGFKHFTEALDAYNQYNLTRIMNYLERARTECLKAADSEIGYEKLPILLYNLGVAYSNKKELFKAQELLFKAIEINPDCHPALLMLAYLYGILNEQKKALDYFEMALKFKPSNVHAIYGKGIALWMLGRYDESLDCYNIAAELYPNDVHALCNKGNVLVNLGKYVEALGCFERALKFNPKDMDSLNGKGFALIGLGRHSEALDCFQRSIELYLKYNT